MDFSNRAIKTPVLALTNHKGGVGKSTLAQLLSFFFTRVLGMRVLAFDLDPQGNYSASMIEMDDRPQFNHPADSPLAMYPNSVNPPDHPMYGHPYSMYETLVEGVLMPYATRVDGLELVPSTGLLSSYDMMYAGDLYRLDEILNDPENLELINSYDLIIIDTPPAVDTCSQNANFAATHILVPMLLERKSMDGISATRALNAMRESHTQRDYSLRLIPNQVDRRMGVHQDVLKELKDSPVYKELLLSEIPHRASIKDLDMIGANPFSPDGLSPNDPLRKIWTKFGIEVATWIGFDEQVKSLKKTERARQELNIHAATKRTKKTVQGA